ncbi:MAG TPA: ABC transporter ATP-binding protein [Vicinamibacterales bacterium]|nr:ABC transporter ATP-binding protein [Vicinamibacterales bacterium]
MTVLSASHLTRQFGARTAVDDVSFEIAAGEVFGLLGPNGAGKTTTLRMLGGLILPTTGTVSLDGTPLTRLNADAQRIRIGFLTETPGLWEQLTVADNMLTYARLFSVQDPQAAVERLLRRFDLWDRRSDRAALLSKGMKQKLALARALVHDPSIILLDEPTANLDPQTSRSVRDLIAELRDRGATVVVSTHNLDEVERIASRVALISTRLIAIGEPRALRRGLFGRRLRITLGARGSGADPAAIATRCGARDFRADETGFTMELEDPDRNAPALIAALVNAGIAVREARDEEPPLEEVYLKLLGRTP